MKSLYRTLLVARQELGYEFRRPLLWVLVVVIALTTYGLSSGNVRIQTGDTAPGEAKAWQTSEFANAFTLTVPGFLLYSFFIAVAAGMVVIHDDELQVRELLHSSGLRPGEYVWGKFVGVLLAFLAVLGFHLLFSIFILHVVPSANAAYLRGPLVLRNHLSPAVVFTLPLFVFLAGTSFAMGEFARRPILVFVLPVALLLACGFFLWTWAPTWLDPRIEQVLMLVEPSGFRWLNETWLKVDRGVQFYNHEPIPYDGPFLLSRLALAAFGLLAVGFSQWHLAASLRGARRGWAWRNSRSTEAGEVRNAARGEPLATLGMGTRTPGIMRSVFTVARAELRELSRQPGLYLFVPMILLQVIGTSMIAVGAFQTPLLQTSGTLAVASVNVLSVLVCLLILFYNVESLRREVHVRLASVLYATPVSSFALLAGKAIACSFVGVVILAAGMLGCIVVLLIQGQVGIELTPFLVTWGLLLSITFFGWSTFVAAVLALARNRYTTYAICLGALILTGYYQLTDKMNWVGNWPLWSALQWSDMGPFQLDRSALVLNRLLVLAASGFCLALAVRFFPRRDWDAVGLASRLRPWPLLRMAIGLAACAAPALVIGILLYLRVHEGAEGAVAKKERKDYWRQNVNTWKDAPLPAITAVDVNLELEPERGWFRTTGHYDFRNHRDKPLVHFPLTGGDHWKNLQWTLNGQPYEPENRSHLYVIRPNTALQPGDTLRVGFAMEGVYPRGVTKNGRGANEFILPAGVVLTSFGPSFVPVLGYLEGVGIEDDNKTEAKVYPDDFFEAVLDSFVGISSPFTTRITITAPQEYRLNSIGVLASETVANGKRTAVWESDQPVRFFNVVAGKWEERHKEGTITYYHPGHKFNIDEISEALAAARKYYSEWFYPYPWRELKLSEFSNLATYAQGFATNITFSEGIGFLTKDDPRGHAAFVVTAHEAAHQWWGNLLTPGKGPGGNVLSEGAAHFSTILLCEQVKGERARIELCKRLEEQYGESRRRDVERPLVKLDGSRPGDTTATYDKGGWVFWMLLQQMGREDCLKGMRAFIERYRLSLDHPVLQDFLATMRPFAKDQAAFDEFARQWFHEVVVPEYRLTDAKLTPQGDAWEVVVNVENVGTGRMPVVIAASHGERFTDDGAASPDYADARATVTLGAGEAQQVTITCKFKPDQVLVDPDAHVLQLLRKKAVVRF